VKRSLVEQPARLQKIADQDRDIDGAEKWHKISKVTNPFLDCNCQK
jgi:hypothetical protein